MALFKLIKNIYKKCNNWRSND